MSGRKKAFGFSLAAVGVLLILILAWAPTRESARPTPPADPKIAIVGVDDN